MNARVPWSISPPRSRSTATEGKKRLLSGNHDGGFEPVARMGRIASHRICKQPHEKTGRSKTVPFPVADGNSVLKWFKPRYIKIDARESGISHAAYVLQIDPRDACCVAPDGVVEIGENAFEDGDFKRVVLPPSVRKISPRAFCKITGNWQAGANLDLTIQAPKRSYAEQYAKKKHLAYQES